MTWSCSMSIFFFSSRRRHTRLTCDWSSDVCSSDLASNALVAGFRTVVMPHDRNARPSGSPKQIGRASCRERVEISGGAVSLKKKQKDSEGVTGDSVTDQTPGYGGP